MRCIWMMQLNTYAAFYFVFGWWQLTGPDCGPDCGPRQTWGLACLAFTLSIYHQCRTRTLRSITRRGAIYDIYNCADLASVLFIYLFIFFSFCRYFPNKTYTTVFHIKNNRDIIYCRHRQTGGNDVCNLICHLLSSAVHSWVQKKWSDLTHIIVQWCVILYDLFIVFLN